MIFPPVKKSVTSKKFVFGGLAVALLIVLTFSGLINRGYESKTISFSKGFLTSEGRSFGSKRMLIRKKQTLTIDYEVRIDKGSLYIHLQNLWAAPNAPPIGQARLKQSDNGRILIPVSETGVYKLWVRGLPDTDGYHLSYTIAWKTG